MLQRPQGDSPQAEMLNADDVPLPVPAPAPFARHSSSYLSTHAASGAPSAEALITRLIAEFRHLPGGLLPLLHAIQDHLGYIPDAAIEPLGQALHRSAAEIHGVISYYSHFRRQLPGRHVVQICRAEACQAVGARALEDVARQRLAMDYGDTSHDRNITLQPVYCLGNCACGPSVRVNDQVYGLMNEARFDQLLETLRTDTVRLY